MWLANKRVRIRPRRPTIALTVLLVSLFAIASVSRLYSGRFDDDQPSSVDGHPHRSSDTAIATARSDFALRPRNHALREPQTQNQHWRITAGYRRPDGVLKSVYLINNEFPGPTIETRPDDRLVIEVENGLEGHEGVTLQWHGLSMRIENGTESLHETIMPGKSLIYNFTNDASQHGTFWYSAHNSTQRINGLYGGFIIHVPVDNQDTENGDTEHLLLVSEWSHRPSNGALEKSSYPPALDNGEAVSDSMVLNGVGYFPCNDTAPPHLIDCMNYPTNQLPGLRLTTEGRNTLRVVNVGLRADIGLSVHGSKLTPLSIDGVEPALSEPSGSVSRIHPEERINILVQLDSVIAHYHSHLEFVLRLPTSNEGDATQIRPRGYPVQWLGI